MKTLFAIATLFFIALTSIGLSQDGAMHATIEIKNIKEKLNIDDKLDVVVWNNSDSTLLYHLEVECYNSSRNEWSPCSVNINDPLARHIVLTSIGPGEHEQKSYSIRKMLWKGIKKAHQYRLALYYRLPSNSYLGSHVAYSVAFKV